MQIEIVNPNGVISYRRPPGHADVAEALRTRGYSVRLVMPPTTGGYGEVLVLLEIGNPHLHYLYYNHETKGCVVFSRSYKPTAEEAQAAVGWTEKEARLALPEIDAPPGGAALSALLSVAASFTSPPPTEAAKSACQELAEDDALLDQYLARLRAAELPSEEREALRGICVDFAEKVLAGPVAQPGDETATPEPLFPRGGIFCWYFGPAPWPVEIVQQHDAFEWEVRLASIIQHDAPQDSRLLIAKTEQLEPLTEGEEHDLRKTGRLSAPHCRSDGDGRCTWKRCPQICDREPEATGRHCPLDTSRADANEER